MIAELASASQNNLSPIQAAIPVGDNATFWYSYGGNFCGAVVVMPVGAALGSLSPRLLDDPNKFVAMQRKTYNLA